MRIGLVVAGGVDESGREHVIPALLWLIERLARRHVLSVYVLRYHPQPRTYTLLGATVRDLGRPTGLWRQQQALTEALRADGPFDLLHAYWALPAGLATAVAGRRLRVPVVLTCDSGEFVALPDVAYGLQHRARQRLGVAAATRFASVVTVCSGYQQQLARARGVRARLIPIGVDATTFTRVTRRDGPPWRLIHVANLNPVKDQSTLLHAFARIRSAAPDAHLDIVGLDTMRGSMQTLAAALGVGQAVTFHGFVPSDALASLYAQAHVAVLSSRHEAAGVVTLEAAACGVPTVGSDVGYVHDWAPERAVAVAPADAPALANAVMTLLSAPQRLGQMADAAHTWTRAHDADWTAAAFEALYDEVVHRT